MKTFTYPLLLVSTLALAACAGSTEPNTVSGSSPTTEPAATSAGAATAAASTTGDASASAGRADMSADQHAAMDAEARAHGPSRSPTGAASTAGNDAPSAGGVQAGWYATGTFRTCGSAQGMKVDKPAEIEAQIRTGGMSAGDPVYVRLEGMPMGTSYMLTRVVQVGSKTPVRDCPMAGTMTQVGG